MCELWAILKQEKWHQTELMCLCVCECECDRERKREGERERESGCLCVCVCACVCVERDKFCSRKDDNFDDSWNLMECLQQSSQGHAMIIIKVWKVKNKNEKLWWRHPSDSAVTSSYQNCNKLIIFLHLKLVYETNFTVKLWVWICHTKVNHRSKPQHHFSSCKLLVKWFEDWRTTIRCWFEYHLLEMYNSFTKSSFALINRTLNYVANANRLQHKSILFWYFWIVFLTKTFSDILSFIEIRFIQ